MRKLTFPSPALVISTVALFVALGGVGYAAVTLPKASVCSAQLKTDAVTDTKIADNAVRSFMIRTNAISSPKVRDNSLTGDDILESSLGPVTEVAGFKKIPLTRATPTPGADAATARAAAPEVPLATVGPLTVYGKCIKDSGTNIVSAELFVKTTADGSISGAALDGGTGATFLNVATPELDRRVDTENAALNAASMAGNAVVAMAPDGTAIRSLTYSGAKNGTLAGPAGQGIYGNGDVCFFGGSIFG